MRKINTTSSIELTQNEQTMNVDSSFSIVPATQAPVTVCSLDGLSRRIAAFLHGWRHWWLCMDGVDSFAYSFSAFSIKAIPSQFWISSDGNMLKNAIQAICRGLFRSAQSMPSQIQRRAEIKIAHEGAESGEVVAFLLKSVAPRVDVAEKALSFALLQKLRQIAYDRAQELHQELLSKKIAIENAEKTCMATIQTSVHDLAFAENRSEEQADRIYTRVLGVLQTLRSSSNEVYSKAQEAAEENKRVPLAIFGLYTLENRAFQGHGYQALFQGQVAQFSQAHQLLREWIFNTDNKLLSLVEVAPNNKTIRAIGCAIAETSTLFVPRIGSYEFSLKTEIFKKMTLFLREVYESNNNVQLSCWVKARAISDGDVTALDLD